MNFLSNWTEDSEDVNFFSNEKYQYSFITTSEGEILHSKYVNQEDSKFEKKIEEHLKKSLELKTIVNQKL